MNYTLKQAQKESAAPDGVITKYPEIYENRSGLRICGCSAGFGYLCMGVAEIPPARFARADFAQVLKTVDSRSVAVGESNLQRVIPHRLGALRRHARLEHRKFNRRGAGMRKAGFLVAFVVAKRAGTHIPKIGKGIVAGMPVGPGDVHS